MQKGGLLKIGFIALFFAPLLIGSGQTAGGGGCGGGAINTTNVVEVTDTPAAAIEVVGGDEVTALSTGDYAASCTDTSCDNLSWEITRADVSALSTLGIAKPDGLGFYQTDPIGDPRGIMMRFKPPLEEGGRTFKIQACNEEGVCGEKTVTVATESSAATDFGDCKYDAIGSLVSVSGVTDIKVSSVWVTCKNQDCFKDSDGNPYRAGTLLWTVCGSNFSPKCANYAYVLTKIDVCGFKSPSQTNGCPDNTNPPKVIGKDGTEYDLDDGTDTEGMSPNPTVFKTLKTLQEEGMNLATDFVKQITKGALDLSKMNFDGLDFWSTSNPLNVLMSREVLDAGHAVIMLGQHILEMGYNFFVAGLWVNTAGTPWDDPNFLYECFADGNGFGKMKDVSGMGQLEIDSASVRLNDPTTRLFSISDKSSYTSPSIVGTSNPGYYDYEFELGFNTKIDNDTVSVGSGGTIYLQTSTGTDVSLGTYNHTTGINGEGDHYSILTFTVSNPPTNTVLVLTVRNHSEDHDGVRGDHREDMRDSAWYYLKIQ